MLSFSLFYKFIKIAPYCAMNENTSNRIVPNHVHPYYWLVVTWWQMSECTHEPKTFEIPLKYFFNQK